MNLTTVDLIGYAAAFFTTLSFLPQTIKIIRTQETEGISIIMYSMMIIGVLTWILYGYLIGNYILLISNLISFICSFPILVIAFWNLRRV